MNLPLTIPASWRNAIAFSLAFNLFLYMLMAALTWKSVLPEQVEYMPVTMMDLPSAEKRVPLAPSAPKPPPAQEQPVEQKPQPVVEKELGMDKTGEEPVQPPAQQPQVVYHPFHKVTRMPYFKNQVKPAYPPSERASGVEAKVIAEVYINQFGGVDAVKIIKSGGKYFDEAVLAAVKNSSFNPAFLEGKPVAAKVQIPFTFRLR